MNITDFTTDQTTTEQQLMDVKAYAAANAKQFNWALVASMTDAAILDAIGKRKNSRRAIVALFDALKGKTAADFALVVVAPEPTNTEKLGSALQEIADEKAAAKRAAKAASRKAQRAAKKAREAA